MPNESVLSELEVVRAVHGFLKGSAFGAPKVVQHYTDSDVRLLPHPELAPFQRFAVDIGGFVLHPDIAGQFDDGETLFAIEAKGEADFVKGLAQAELYKEGFHYSFLALSERKLARGLKRLMQRKNIGLITVGKQVKVEYFPEAINPRHSAHSFLRRQMETVAQVSAAQTYQFNIPTHYLAWAIVLKSGEPCSVQEVLKREIPEYPFSMSGRRSALAGAQKLGLVKINGDIVQLTEIGAASCDALPLSLEELAKLHVVAAKGQPLAFLRPEVGAILSLLLMQDPMVRLVLEGLHRYEDKQATFPKLARACDELDHARAPIFFLEPAAAALSDSRGRIDWDGAEPTAYRSRMFYQYKSILIHSGLLGKTSLGGASVKSYRPERDIWRLGRSGRDPKWIS